MGIGVHELSREIRGIRELIERLARENLPGIQEAIRQIEATGRTIQEGMPGILEALAHMGDAAKGAATTIEYINRFLGYLEQNSTTISNLIGFTIGMQFIMPIAQIFMGSMNSFIQRKMDRNLERLVEVQYLALGQHVFLNRLTAAAFFVNGHHMLNPNEPMSEADRKRVEDALIDARVFLDSTAGHTIFVALAGNAQLKEHFEGLLKTLYADFNEEDPWLKLVNSLPVNTFVQEPAAVFHSLIKQKENPLEVIGQGKYDFNYNLALKLTLDDIPKAFEI